MPMECSGRRWRWNTLFFMVSVSSLCCVCFLACSGNGYRGDRVLLHLYVRRITSTLCSDQECYGDGQLGRRLLGGPGSYPPRCTSKCGTCTPCYPVHVAVPPGVPVTTEYYPEAWRCKCGNRLYMP